MPETAPLVTTRDALAEWFHRELGIERCNRHDTNVKPACENWADQLLASGALIDAASLAEDEALVEEVWVARRDAIRAKAGPEGEHFPVPGVLGALAAALTARTEEHGHA